MRKKQREKGRSRTVKGEVFTQQQLQEAHEQFDVEAAMFIFRLKSLKRGQSRSLLTQAARHHAAQVNFSVFLFRPSLFLGVMPVKTTLVIKSRLLTLVLCNS